MNRAIDWEEVCLTWTLYQFTVIIGTPQKNPMEAMASHEYIAILKLDISQIVAPRDVIEKLEIEQERAQTLQAIQNTTGLIFDVVIGNTDLSLPPFSGTGAGKTHIREDMLDPKNKVFAIHIAQQKKEEALNGFTEVNMKENLSAFHRKALEKALGVDDITDIDWVKGFNDFIAASKYGSNEQSSNNGAEISATQKLEELARKEMNFSLKEAFANGNQVLFFRRLEMLCQNLMRKSHWGKN